MMKKFLVFALAIFAVLIVFPNLAHALPPDPGGDPDTGVPLDGGLSILVAAGVGYGAKKIRDARKAYKTV